MSETLTFEQVQETVHKEVLPNGLTVLVIPKQDFQKTFAVFTTNYGSIDNRFVPIGKNEPVNVPDGIAHFLEHKMFEDEKGDVFQTFGEQGASANAFTSFTKTAYLFSSTQEVDKNLTTLLDFVQHPYFTDESVEKEKGIIGQEIRMYDDNPDWQLFFHLLSSLYHHHPVKIDIAGTVDSIQQISKEDLYTCYETFYHPGNMILCVAGNADPAHTIELVKQNQEQKTFKEPEPVERVVEDEPAEAVQRVSTVPMSVNTPKCMVGYKIPVPDKEGKALLRYELTIEILLETLFGAGSDVYESLYREGLIDDSFSSEFMLERSFSFAAFGGDTNDPDALADRIIQAVEDAKSTGINENQIEVVRRKKIGSFLKQLNSPEFLANQYTEYAFFGLYLFDVIPLLEEITMEEIQALLPELFQEHNRAVSRITKKQEQSS
ncbi:EF-P 5-aminopentanol modification-associated protein YfmH [Salibacterium qingdaonense]|uniref:Predicted Zn-dependent peptidase n=1 Tax=Salibacterium qingdaonense TaxID=266892 RepID=A0A1I4K961_9BACI|nr:pitrilysin family protein [Salibacterium qingdaonense]SFL75335.1 Predicted Zn-dependent peptidase [Salibacterium qingdaonense]